MYSLEFHICLLDNSSDLFWFASTQTKVSDLYKWLVTNLLGETAIVMKLYYDEFCRNGYWLSFWDIIKTDQCVCVCAYGCGIYPMRAHRRAAGIGGADGCGFLGLLAHKVVLPVAVIYSPHAIGRIIADAGCVRSEICCRKINTSSAASEIQDGLLKNITKCQSQNKP